MPRKIAKAPGPIFKTEKPTATSNETSTNSVVNERQLKGATTLLNLNRDPRQIHKKLPLVFINFSVSMGRTKIAAGMR
jgi:hypothetical protein